MSSREHWKKMLPLIQAFVEGKDIEYKNPALSWGISASPGFADPPERYRIKEEPRELWYCTNPAHGWMLTAPFLNKEAALFHISESKGYTHIMCITRAPHTNEIISVKETKV